MSAIQDGTFETIFEKVGTESKSTVELGTRFEKIIKGFPQTDLHYKNRFSKAYLWMELSKRDDPDICICLISEQYNGEIRTIQCKCHDVGNLEMKQVSLFDMYNGAYVS